MDAGTGGHDAIGAHKAGSTAAHDLRKRHDCQAQRTSEPLRKFLTQTTFAGPDLKGGRIC